VTGGTLPPRNPEETMSHPSPRLRRLAGAFALAHVVLFLGALAMSGPPTVHEGQEGIEHSFQDDSLPLILTAGYLTVLALLVLVPVMTYLGRTLGRRSEAGRWAASTAVAAGLGHVVVLTGTAFAAGGAATWGNASGLDLDTTLAINNIRNFAYYLSLPLAGVSSIGIGISALADGVLTRWLGWGGVAVGAALLLAIPAAGVGIQYGMPLFLLWWLGVGISLLRTPTPEPGAAQPTVSMASAR
jgi:hypothetical protein